MDSDNRISKEKIKSLNKMAEYEHVDEFEKATQMQNDLLKAISKAKAIEQATDSKGALK